MERPRAGRPDDSVHPGRIRLAAVGPGRLQREGSVGQHLPGGWGASDLGAARNGRVDITRFDLSTNVVLERAMVNAPANDSIGRGATLALNCTMCHGAQGMSASNAPNLAGQYPEVVIKQLLDYKSGKRSSSIMEALAKNLSDQEVADLAAYYAYLPKARTAPTTYDETLPALVRVGAPLRNIAPCVSCHGGIDQKLGAPWIEGMPKDYLVQQLQAFRTGQRRNDAESQMRNVVRTMTDAEIDDVSTFYARKAAAGSSE
jgi:cytochrome c553